ncbi:HEPN domain-containing protein [Saccharospirillum impatiens]|uniref:HEPN domain-containing protein n=1 Tax=Saccharospirillum impatiens TaxID=169438 RepID=UPI0012F97B26|nr:HEPN domain-containing protein [Saccharospirillum impatiens]
MNNDSVRHLLDSCDNEIASLESLVHGLGIGSSIVPYLSKYGLVKACGTIEQAFKSIISDKCSYRAKKQIKNFLTQKVRNSSSNPSYSNMCNLLKDFDGTWKDGFKAAIDAHPQSGSLKTSLQSLVDARNEFAHGGSPKISIGDVSKYYSDARKVIECLDRVVG